MFGLRKRTQRPTRKEIDRLIRYYNKQTASVTNEKAFDFLMSDDVPLHLFRLIDIAENCYYPLGITKAIVLSYKLGYIQGRKAV